MALEPHTIYVHAREAGMIAKAGDPISAGAQIYKDDGLLQTFAHAMVVSNVSGTLAADLSVTDTSQLWYPVHIDVKGLP